MHKYYLYRILIKIYGLVLFLIFLVVPVGISTIIVKAINYFSGFYYKNNKIIELLVNESVLSYLIILYLIFFVMILISNKKLNKKIKIFDNDNWFESLGKALVPSIMAFGLAIFSMSFISTIINLLPDILDLKKSLILPNKALIELLNSVNNEFNFKVIIWLSIIIVIAPVYEEILFRGFLQGFTEKFIKYKNFDIILVALLFGIFHLPSFLNVIYAFIIGIFLSIQRKKYKSVNISIWMHSIMNFASVVLAITYQYLNTK